MSEKYKIIILSRNLEPNNGLTNALLNLAFGLIERNSDNNLDILFGSIDPIPKEIHKTFKKVKFNSISLLRHPFKWSKFDFIESYLNSKKIINEQKPDILIATGFRAYLLCKMGSIINRLPVIYWKHTILDDSDILRKNILRTIARKDTFIAISDASLKHMQFKGHQGNEHVLYYGIVDEYSGDENSINEHRNKYRRILKIPNETIVFGYVARFIQWKDHKTLVLAFNELVKNVKSNLSIKLLLIGRGPLRNDVLDQVRRLNLEDKVVFLDEMENVREFMTAFDVYVHPAYAEGFGLTVVESMLARVPPIVVRTGALPEIVRNGESGLIRTPKDTHSLFVAMRDMTNLEYRRSLGNRARVSAIERFSCKAYANNFIKIVQSQLNSPRGKMNNKVTHRKPLGRDYEGIPIHAEDRLHEECITLLKKYLPVGSRVLDIGAGSGAFSLRLRNNGYTVEACDADISDFKPTDIPVKEIDLNASIPNDFGTFDAIVAIEVIEHLENPHKFFRDCRILLNKEGVLLFSTPNVADLDSRRLFITNGHFFLFRENCVFNQGHMSILPKWLLDQILSKEEYEIIVCVFIGKKSRPGIKKIITPLMNLILIPMGIKIPLKAAFKPNIMYIVKPK